MPNGPGGGTCQPPDPNELIKSLKKLARQFGKTEKEIRDAIHAAKRGMSRAGSRRNPDVRVDPRTGEICPETPSGGVDDSIGNIFDFLF